MRPCLFIPSNFGYFRVGLFEQRIILFSSRTNAPFSDGGVDRWITTLFLAWNRLAVIEASLEGFIKAYDELVNEVFRLPGPSWRASRFTKQGTPLLDSCAKTSCCLGCERLTRDETFDQRKVAGFAALMVSEVMLGKSWPRSVAIARHAQYRSRLVFRDHGSK